MIKLIYDSKILSSKLLEIDSNWRNNTKVEILACVRSIVLQFLLVLLLEVGGNDACRKLFAMC